MKKLLSLILCLAMCLSACFALVACGETNEEVKPDAPQVNKDPFAKEVFGESFGFIIRNLEINMGTSKAALKVAELYVAQGEDGFVGGGVGEIEVTGTDAMTAKAAIILKNNDLYVQVKGAMAENNMGVSISLDAEKLLGYALESAGVSLEAVMDYKEESLDADIEKFKGWATEQLIPALGNLDAYALTEAEIAAICTIFENVADKFIKVEAVGEDQKISLDFSGLIACIDDLKNKKGSEFVDIVFGEGTYAKIKAATPGILSFTVGDLVAEFKKNGGSLEDLEAAINALLVLAEAPEGYTLQAMIAQLVPDFDGTLADFFALEEIAGLSLNIIPALIPQAAPECPPPCSNCFDGVAIGYIISDGYEIHLCEKCYEENFSSAFELYPYEPVVDTPADEVPATLQEIMDEVFAGLEAASLAELFDLTDDTISQIKASLEMVAGTVKFEVVADKDAAIKSIKYNLDMSSVATEAIAMSLNVNKTASGAVGNIEMKQAGVTMLKADLEVKINANGYYNKDALAEIVAAETAANAVLDASDIADLIAADLYCTIESQEDIIEDGKAVGVVIVTEYNETYTVYFDDLFAIMVMESGDMKMGQAVFFCEVVHTEYEYDEYGDIISTSTYTTESTVTASIMVP